MLRALILAAMLTVVLAASPVLPAAELPVAAPFVPSAEVRLVGPAEARGAVVWLHGSYDPATEPAPPLPGWLLEMPARRYDLWMFNRGSWRRDPLGPGGEQLLEGLGALRAAGYRRVVVAGFSRGAFIGLAALARPDLVDAVVAVSPAAHGTRADRRAQALADFAVRMDEAGPVRLALALLRDDPFDPDPVARAAAARGSVPGRAGMLLLLDRPEGLEGHMGSFDPGFAARFGACLGAFADGAADASACAGH